MILLENSYSFYTLSLNNLANSFANVFSIVGIKWTILVNWFTITRILSYPWAKDNLVIKFTDIYVQGFLGIELGINFPASYSMQSLFLW